MEDRGTPYCSPTAEKNYERNGTCFPKKALVRLVKAWNATHARRGEDQFLRVAAPGRRPAKELWEALNERMGAVCKGVGREACWVERLDQGGRTPEIARSVRPKRPGTWKANPHQWLTNYDILAVMKQYEEDPAKEFLFLGVFPIDFEAKTMFGSCLFQEVCSFNIQSMIAAVGAKGKKRGKRPPRFVGMITNLDRHDESGSHWTALFLCIDPFHPCFGAYYYDSVRAAKPPAEVWAFMERMRDEAHAALAGHAALAEHARPFALDYVKERHQYGHSECGMFCIMYFENWFQVLEELGNRATFRDVARIHMTDDMVYAARNRVFRPAQGGGGIGKPARKRASAP